MPSKRAQKRLEERARIERIAKCHRCERASEACLGRSPGSTCMDDGGGPARPVSGWFRWIQWLLGVA